MKTIIIGLGNPVLSDDGVGIRVSRELQERLGSDAYNDISVAEVYAGGIRLMEAMAGYDRALIIDAMVTGRHKPGQICRMGLDELKGTKNLICAHDTSLSAAIEIGRAAGLKLPTEIIIWGIEAGNTHSFSEELTDDTAKAVPLAIEEILQFLKDETYSL